MKMILRRMNLRFSVDLSHCGRSALSSDLGGQCAAYGQKDESIQDQTQDSCASASGNGYSLLLFPKQK